MAIKTARTETQKITIVLPKIVLQRMDELIPARQRSRFIAQALSERLALEEQVLALEESAGAWSDASHPELADEEAIDRWLVDLRTSWVLSPAADHGDLSA
jgi:metal-responsive CopG/Arc/MetJ family transcriptional regulator